MKTRTLALLLPIFALSGCVHVNLPEHMVSDTVDAGKDLVHAISRTGERLDEVKQNGNTYTLARLGSQDLSVGDLKRSCVNQLVSRTKSKLAVEQLDYAVGAQSIDSRGDGLVVKCEISVKG